MFCGIIEGVMNTMFDRISIDATVCHGQAFAGKNVIIGLEVSDYDAVGSNRKHNFDSIETSR